MSGSELQEGCNHSKEINIQIHMITIIHMRKVAEVLPPLSLSLALSHGVGILQL